MPNPPLVTTATGATATGVTAGTSTNTISGGNPDGTFTNSIMPNIANANSDINPILKKTSEICQAVGVAKQQGGPVVALADKIGRKAIAISDIYMNKLDGFNKELEALQGNPKLSNEERGKKITEIKNKIAACQKEGQAKIEVLATLMDKIPALNGLLKIMSEKNIPAGEIMGLFEKIIQDIDSNPSSFSGKEDENVDEKIKNSALGQNSDKKFDTKKANAKSRLQGLDNKLKTATKPEEKEKIAIEKESILMELEIITSLQSMFGK